MLGSDAFWEEGQPGVRAVDILRSKSAGNNLAALLIRPSSCAPAGERRRPQRKQVASHTTGWNQKTLDFIHAAGIRGQGWEQPGLFGERPGHRSTAHSLHRGHLAEHEGCRWSPASLRCWERGQPAMHPQGIGGCISSKLGALDTPSWWAPVRQSSYTFTSAPAYPSLSTVSWTSSGWMSRFFTALLQRDVPGCWCAHVLEVTGGHC